MEVTMVDIGNGRTMPIYHNVDFNFFVKRCVEANLIVEHANGLAGTIKYTGPFTRAVRTNIQTTADKLRPVTISWKRISHDGYIIIPRASSGTEQEKWR